MESLAHLSDEDLMTRYQNGQELAFEILFERHRGKVYGYLLKKLRDDVSADDVFQTIEKLHKLFEKGILTQLEFETKKAELLKKV